MALGYCGSSSPTSAVRRCSASGRRRRLVEVAPAGLADALLDGGVLLRQLRQDVDQAMDRAALTADARSELLDRLDEPGSAVAAHGLRHSQATLPQVAAEVEPVFMPFSEAETDGVQDALTGEGVAPRRRALPPSARAAGSG